MNKKSIGALRREIAHQALLPEPNSRVIAFPSSIDKKLGEYLQSLTEAVARIEAHQRELLNEMEAAQTTGERDALRAGSGEAASARFEEIAHEIREQNARQTQALKLLVILLKGLSGHLNTGPATPQTEPPSPPAETRYSSPSETARADHDSPSEGIPEEPASAEETASQLPPAETAALEPPADEDGAEEPEPSGAPAPPPATDQEEARNEDLSDETHLHEDPQPELPLANEAEALRDDEHEPAPESSPSSEEIPLPPPVGFSAANCAAAAKPELSIAEKTAVISRTYELIVHAQQRNYDNADESMPLWYMPVLRKAKEALARAVEEASPSEELEAATAFINHAFGISLMEKHLLGVFDKAGFRECFGLRPVLEDWNYGDPVHAGMVRIYEETQSNLDTLILQTAMLNKVIAEHRRQAFMSPEGIVKFVKPAILLGEWEKTQQLEVMIKRRLPD